MVGYQDKELVASKEVLEEIFNEQEVVPIYRAHFETEKAKEEERAAHGLPSTTTEAEGFVNYYVCILIYRFHLFDMWLVYFVRFWLFSLWITSLKLSVLNMCGSIPEE